MFLLDTSRLGLTLRGVLHKTVQIHFDKLLSVVSSATVGLYLGNSIFLYTSIIFIFTSVIEGISVLNLKFLACLSNQNTLNRFS